MAFATRTTGLFIIVWFRILFTDMLCIDFTLRYDGYYLVTCKMYYSIILDNSWPISTVSRKRQGNAWLSRQKRDPKNRRPLDGYRDNWNCWKITIFGNRKVAKALTYMSIFWHLCRFFELYRYISAWNSNQFPNNAQKQIPTNREHKKDLAQLVLA